MPFKKPRSAPTRSFLKPDPKAIDRLIRGELAEAFAYGMDGVVEVAESVVAVDAGRMQDSVRHPEPVVTKQAIVCPLIVGGVKVRGVYKEQDREEEVDYSIFVELKYGTLRSHVPEFGDAIVARMRAKRNAS